MDSHGRVFYIDHNTRTTTWQRPTSTVTDDSVDEHRRQLDRRSHFHFHFHFASVHRLDYLYWCTNSYTVNEILGEIPRVMAATRRFHFHFASVCRLLVSVYS